MPPIHQPIVSTGITLENQHLATLSQLTAFNMSFVLHNDSIVKAEIEAATGILKIAHQTKSHRVVVAWYTQEGRKFLKEYYESFDFVKRVPKGFMFRVDHWHP